MRIDLDAIKALLKLDTPVDDELIERLIGQVTAQAADFMRVELDVNADMPEPVVHAVEMMVTYLYERRDNLKKDEYEVQVRAFEALLYPDRDLEKFF